MSSLQATPVHPDPSDGGGVGGNAASSPGPSSSYPWVSSVAGVSTATGNKLTEIPTVSWVVRGGLTVDLTLYHNSEISFTSASRGAKWSLIYDTGLKSDASGNVHMGWGNGNRYDFGYSGGSYSPPPGIHDRLVANGSPITSYDLIKKDQTDWHFAPYGSPGNFLLTSISDENGNSVTINRAANGGMLGLVDSTGRGVTFGYNSSYYTSIQDPLSRVINFGFDGSGNLASVTYPIINGTSYSINLGYDGNHNVTSIQDLRGNTALLSYNAADNSLAWEQDNLGNRTTFTYGYDGVRSISNALATTVTDANSHSTAYWYDSTGRLSAVYDALGNHDAYTFDASNNETQTVDRRGYSWNNTYDGMGNVLTAADPYGNTTTNTYNGHNRPLTTRLPLGRSTAATYDASDNLTQVREKDASGSVLATTTYTVSSATYGLVTDKYDANNHHTAYAYDYNGYLNSVTTPLGHQTQGAYDVLGFQTSRTDAMGRTTAYTPDAWERLVTTTYPDNSTRTFGYDPDSNLTAFANTATGTWSRTYDADNRMTAEYCGTALDDTHTYDAAGQKGLPSTVTDFDGRVISYAYSTRNELTSVGDSLGTATYQYDADGDKVQVNDPNGMAAQWGYDNADHLVAAQDATSSGSVIAAYNYGINADNQITTLTEGTGPYNAFTQTSQTTYGYDAQGHLTAEARTGQGAMSQAFSYDGAGNRTNYNNGSNNPYSYDADDEPTGAGGYNTFVLGYNANGDRTSESFNGQVTTFGYDYDDQLTSLSKPGTAVTYRYDPLGRQVSRQVNGTFTGYYMDGTTVLIEKQNGVNTAQYLWGSGLVRCNGEYPLTDGRSNVRVTTNASQQVSSSNQPDAFGISSVTAGTASAYAYGGAVGYREDGVFPAGLSSALTFQKVGARYYDPAFGCFLTRDTELGEKPYAYCDGDPVNCIDPSGHQKKKDTKKTQTSEEAKEFMEFVLKILEAYMGGLSITATMTYHGPSSIHSPNGQVTNIGATWSFTFTLKHDKHEK